MPIYQSFRPRKTKRPSVAGPSSSARALPHAAENETVAKIGPRSSFRAGLWGAGGERSADARSTPVR